MRFSKIIRNPSEETNGMACSVASPCRIRKYRKVNLSTMSEAITAANTPRHIASGQEYPPSIGNGNPCSAAAQATMPVIIKIAGIVKFKKFRIPIVKVNATATVT